VPDRKDPGATAHLNRPMSGDATRRSVALVRIVSRDVGSNMCTLAIKVGGNRQVVKWETGAKGITSTHAMISSRVPPRSWLYGPAGLGRAKPDTMDVRRSPSSWTRLPLPGSATSSGEPIGAKACRTQMSSRAVLTGGCTAATKPKAMFSTPGLTLPATLRRSSRSAARQFPMLVYGPKRTSSKLQVAGNSHPFGAINWSSSTGPCNAVENGSMNSTMTRMKVSRTDAATPAIVN